MELPLISVLVPVYHRERFIVECLDSVLAQTYENFEVVVVDNASTDQTWDICCKYAARKPKVRVFRNDMNIGPVRNWIRCVREARGVYSKILFSDDCLESDCLEKMVPWLEDQAVGLVYCAARIGIDRKSAQICYDKPHDTLLPSFEFVNLVLNSLAPVSPGAVLLRTNDLIANLHEDFPTAALRPYAQYGAGPDVMISFLTLEHYPKIAHIAQPLVYFRAHPGSFSMGECKRQVAEAYRSVFSFYLQKRFGTNARIRYLGKAWLDQIIVTRHWVSPKVFLRENEGVGNLGELLQLFWYAGWAVILKMIGHRGRIVRYDPESTG